MTEKTDGEGPQPQPQPRPRLKSRLVVSPAYGSAIASELMRAIAEAHAGSGDIVWGPDDTNGGGGFSRG